MQTYETHKWSPHKRCHTGLFLLRPVWMPVPIQNVTRSEGGV